MLESLEQSNIKRMAVEKEVRPEVIFDPKKDLRPEDREALAKAFDVVPNPLVYKSWTAFARGLQELMPEYKLSLERVAGQFIQSYVSNQFDEFYKPYTAGFLADAKELYPKLSLRLLTRYKTKWSEFLADSESHKSADFVIIMDAMKRLGSTDEEIGLDDEAYKTAHKLLHDTQFIGNEYLQIRIAAGIKRLWPGQSLQIEPSMVEDWKDDLDRQRQQNNWRMFAEMASEMKSLNPEQIEDVNNNQAVPEQRSF